MQEWLGHSAPPTGIPQALPDHLRTVSSIAAAFAAPIGLSEEAALAGILHDCGKYGQKFQDRLQGKARHIDHWSLGAWWAVKLQAVGAALAIHGHHVGLDVLSPSRMMAIMDPQALLHHHPLSLTLSETSLETIIERFEQDGLVAAPPSKTIVPKLPALNASLDTMLDVRMLYSCLVDADFLDTEAHFNQGAQGNKVFRDRGQALTPMAALALVKQRVHTMESSSSASVVQDMRHRVWTQSLSAGNQADGFRTLTAPTGTGKTLAMLAYALQHAARFQKDRIIVVLPYLTLIEQTAKIYRDLFAMFGPRYIIEHHSLSGNGDSESTDGSARLLAENWDAPIIITTTVQLMESLFSNRPGRCRKLHNLAHSVILLDEVQSFPLRLVVPTVAMLNSLSQRYHSTVVFATATQPAFSDLVSSYAHISQVPVSFLEMMDDPGELFDTVRRFDTVLRNEAQSWESIATEICKFPSALIMVNLKRHAWQLAEVVNNLQTDNQPLFHLSTNMCPLHRTATLDRIRLALEGGGCRVVATQCIEAGVDVDFPVVYRAWAPIDSLAQAAGRCNREGTSPTPGQFVVFQPEEDRYPPGVYRQATDITRGMNREGLLDLHSPESFAEYWHRLYDIHRPEQTYAMLLEEIRSLDFPSVDRDYRLIERATLSILVPYDLPLYEALAAQARAQGLSAKWIRKAQPLAVNIYQPRDDDLIWQKLEPVYVHTEKTSWYIYLAPNDYSLNFGLVPPSADILMA